MKKTAETERADWIRSALLQYEGPLIRYVCRIVGDLDRARDVVQDTFLKLCAADREKVEDRLAAWLYTVARNRALDVYKKERRMSPTSDTALEVFESALPSPADVAEREEAKSQVFLALEKLPPRQQEVLRLKFQENLSYKEIAEITGNTVSYVGVLLHTALKSIRESLHKQPGLAEASGGHQS
jgi:RNA polymerase sigma-70 factor (ECF subfamily)